MVPVREVMRAKQSQGVAALERAKTEVRRPLQVCLQYSIDDARIGLHDSTAQAQRLFTTRCADGGRRAGGRIRLERATKRFQCNCTTAHSFSPAWYTSMHPLAIVCATWVSWLRVGERERERTHLDSPALRVAYTASERPGLTIPLSPARTSSSLCRVSSPAEAHLPLRLFTARRSSRRPHRFCRLLFILCKYSLPRFLI